MRADQVRELVAQRSKGAIPGLGDKLLTTLLWAQIKAESEFDEYAISPAGAKGLAQFTDSTWSQFGQGSPFDPEEAIKAQIGYMKYLYARFPEIPHHLERWQFALAAYNTGVTNINSMLAYAREACGVPRLHEDWKAGGAAPGDWQRWEYASQHLGKATGSAAQETLTYVQRVMRFAMGGEEPE